MGKGYKNGKRRLTLQNGSGKAVSPPAFSESILACSL